MNYLFSNKLKKISGWIFYLTIPTGMYLLFTQDFDDLLKIKVFSIFPYEWIGSKSSGFSWIENGIVDEIFTFIIIFSGIINSFSKEKIEDELISKIRMESLILSLYINYGLLLICTFFIYDLAYMYVLIFNLFLVILLFNLIFKYRLFKHTNS